MIESLPGEGQADPIRLHEAWRLENGRNSLVHLLMSTKDTLARKPDRIYC